MTNPYTTFDNSSVKFRELYTILAIQQLQKARTDTLYLN